MEQQKRSNQRPSSQPGPSGQRPRSDAAARQKARAAKRRRQQRLRLLLGAAVLLVVVLVVVLCVACNRGPKSPAVIDPGTTAGAWQKNEAGYYFNDVGEPILAAAKKGIDVSKYQGEVDWEKAQAAGIDFAILRCGYGSEWNGEGDYAQDDEQWRRNADECTRLGIPFGAYLYSYATTEEQARLEAEHVARLLGLVSPPHEGLGDYTAAPYHLDYPVYYDLEDKAITGLYPEEMANLTKVFFDRLHELGYQGEDGIYASANWTRARLSDPAFDPWRENLWIARFASTLDYTGTYSIWQSTYSEPGARYGVQSETVDVDFVMEELTVTGITDSETASFSTDTYKNELWLPSVKETVTLTTNEPAESEDGQKIFWSSDNKDVATVSKKGVVKAKGEGECTVTAALADGRCTAQVKVRVGAVTVPVYFTANLSGQTENGEVSFADLCALKAGNPDAILLDAGGSLHGTVRTSLTGGMDMTSAFAAAGYDLQAFDASDLAFGTDRLLADTVTAAGSSVAANLLTESGEPLLARSTSWNRNRISNGMNVVLEEAGKKIGFFSLASTGNTAHAEALTTADLAKTASEQTAALQAKGADAVICIVGPDTPANSLAQTLTELGVTAVITNGQEGLSGTGLCVGTADGWQTIGKLELTFQPDGSVSAAAGQVSPAELKSARGSYTAEQQKAYDSAYNALQKLAEGDEEVRAQALFTFEENETAAQTVSFTNYLASYYAALADGDRDSWPAEASGLTLTALAGGVTELEYGEVTRGALCDALPTGERLVLVKTTSAAIGQLIDSGTVTRTYEESLFAYDVLDGPALLVTDTATLRTLNDPEAVILRDYGDAFWDVRMNINDATAGFTQPFVLPEAPRRGAGRK